MLYTSSKSCIYIYIIITASQSKNAVCALQINNKLLPFPLNKFCRNEQTSNSFSQLMEVSAISNMGKYNFLAWEGLKLNCMFNGSICYDL